MGCPLIHLRPQVFEDVHRSLCLIYIQVPTYFTDISNLLRHLLAKTHSGYAFTRPPRDQQWAIAEMKVPSDSFFVGHEGSLMQLA